MRTLAFLAIGFAVGFTITLLVAIHSHPNISTCHTLEIRATAESSMEVQGPLLVIHAPGEIRCAEVWRQQSPQPLSAAGIQ